ncbi:MAG: DNA polymerase III subunit gamma/tau [Pyrinomonadaceae bacterium]
MSYQVIARKWRPQVFDEVTGQEVITRSLRNALEYDRLHHAYLFSGARGVGKTTTARILAKALNCHKTKNKPNLTPCHTDAKGACPSCIEISESRSIDVLEIDAASHTGIDDVRDTIINSIDFNPARDRYRVFIIDEVHQLSKPAFNALLKTLEEPPPNVVFVMATTELHKVPETILSRCQEFEFRTISLQKIFDRLKLIANAEKIDIDDEALRELARSGEGSMRDAQSNFDQVISFSADKITSADVTNALGFAGVEVLSKTIEAIADKDVKAVMNLVDDLISRGHDLRNFCRDLLALFRDLLVFKVAGDEQNLFEAAVFSSDDMKRMSANFAEADLIRFFNSLAETETALREAAHPRYMLEIGLVKLLEMRELPSMESIIERLDALATGAPLPEKPQTASTQAAAVSSATLEKKTLNPEHESAATDVFEEPPDDFPQFDEPFPEADPVVELSAVKEVTVAQVRLAPLTSADLEHIADQRLDDAYEEKLSFTGDDLLPIGNAAKFAEAFSQTSQPIIQKPLSNGTATATGAAATAPAIDVSAMIPDHIREMEDIELPTLGDNPTDEELRAYAEAHPAVRRAKRVFQAKIIGVKRA